MFHSVLTLYPLSQLCGAITTVSGSTTSSAALSDLVTGADLGAAFGQLGAYAGVGVLLGPAIAGQVLAATGGGGLKYTYLMGAVVAAFQGVLNYRFLSETLEESKRRPFDFSTCNPLSFLEIFKLGRTTATLTLVSGLQCFPEGKSIADLNMQYISADIGMSQQGQTYFVMAFGASMILAGKMGGSAIHFLGGRNFTSASNLLTAAALSLWGTTRSTPMFWTG